MKYTIKGSNEITVKDWLAMEKGATSFVAAMTNQTTDAIKKVPLKAFETLKELCEKAVAEIQPYDPHSVTVGGIEYAIMPDLRDFEAGAMIDIMEADDKDKEAYHIAVLSSLFRPVTQRIGKVYSVEAYTGQQRAELLTMPRSVYMGAEVFFSTTVKTLQANTLASLEKAVQVLREEATLLLQSSDGSQP